MPVEYNDTYIPPKILFEGHLQTIYPGLFRKVKKKPSNSRKRIDTPDGDFLDLDLFQNNSKQLVIISHGLEGDSQRPYVLGIAKTCFLHGFDVIAWNYRGCSGEMNKKRRFYHSGATEDLETVIRWAINNYQYEEVILIGFSLGGNLTLKYLGDGSEQFKEVKKAIVFSVPLDLRAGCINIGRKSNYLYAKRFINSLSKKIRDKNDAIPGYLDISTLDKIRTLYEFDDLITAPLHGFKNADDYYKQCSSINYVENIQIETRIVNAQNDPLLPFECIDPKKFKALKDVTLEITESGGHCGYPSFNNDGTYWSEKRTIEFLS